MYFTSSMIVAGEVSDQGDKMGNRDHPSAFQMCTGASSNAASSVAHSGCDQPTKQAHILDIIWHGMIFCSQMDPIRKIVWYPVYWPEHWLREVQWLSKVTRLDSGRAGASPVLWVSSLGSGMGRKWKVLSSYISTNVFKGRKGKGRGNLNWERESRPLILAEGFKFPHNPFIRSKNKD